MAEQMYEEKGAGGKRRYTAAEIAEPSHVSRKTIGRPLKPPADDGPPFTIGLMTHFACR